MKEIDTIVEVLSQAAEQGRGCLCFVRCTSPDEVAAARAALLEQSRWSWHEIDAENAPMGHDVVARAASLTFGPVDACLAYGLPAGGREGPPVAWYASMAPSASLIERPGGPRLVVLVGVRQMKALNDQAPRFWRAKRAFVAWPPPADATAGERATTRPATGYAPRPQQHEAAGPDAERIAAMLEEKFEGMEAGVDKARMMLRAGLIRSSQGQIEPARVTATRAARLFREAGDPRGLAQCYELLGTLAERAGNGDQAIEWLQYATDSWHAAGDEGRKGECHAKLGHLNYVRGNRERAAQHFQLAIEIDEAMGNKAKVAAGLRRLGLMAEEEQKFPLAEKLYSDAAEMVRSLGDHVGLSRCYHHLGRLCERMGEYEEALKWHNESLSIKESLSDRLGMATSYHHIGNTFVFLKELAQAREFYERALAIEEEFGDIQGRAATTQQLADVAMKEYRWGDALGHFLVAQHLWKQLGSGVAVSLIQNIAQAREMLDAETVAAVEHEVHVITSKPIAQRMPTS